MGSTVNRMTVMASFITATTITDQNTIVYTIDITINSNITTFINTTTNILIIIEINHFNPKTSKKD